MLDGTRWSLRDGLEDAALAHDREEDAQVGESSMVGISD
jgi:hypothetical protein